MLGCSSRSSRNGVDVVTIRPPSYSTSAVTVCRPVPPSASKWGRPGRSPLKTGARPAGTRTPPGGRSRVRVSRSGSGLLSRPLREITADGRAGGEQVAASGGVKTHPVVRQAEFQPGRFAAGSAQHHVVGANRNFTGQPVAPRAETDFAAPRPCGRVDGRGDRVGVVAAVIRDRANASTRKIRSAGFQGSARPAREKLG